MNNNDSFIMELKPIFNKKIIFFRFIPLQIFASFWLGIFFKILEVLIFDNFNIRINNLGLIVGVSVFLLFPFLSNYYLKKVYLKTKYLIYSDRIEYQEGFFNIEIKTILFTKITEINLKINIFQEKNKLGSIYLSIPNFNKKGIFNGLIIKDIKEPNLVYKKILMLMKS
ncbi:MAG: PH domain-containing protein [Fusobacterium sp. JB019]|nr:PH domain-containing protein [Fusobacterium sp. JB019]